MHQNFISSQVILMGFASMLQVLFRNLLVSTLKTLIIGLLSKLYLKSLGKRCNSYVPHSLNRLDFIYVQLIQIQISVYIVAFFEEFFFNFFWVQSFFSFSLEEENFGPMDHIGQLSARIS